MTVVDLFWYRWMIASSMIQLGLSWWQAWICVWIGYGFVGPFVALNARQGALFHIPFPVVIRTSFGLFGSFRCTFTRGVMAWYVLLPFVGHSIDRVIKHLVWCASKYWRRLC